jgi:SAM-dependent methyltransferase
MVSPAVQQGRWWSERARDATLLEPGLDPLYCSALDRLGVGAGSDLLDVGCGAGRALELAARRGTNVAGIDAASGLVFIGQDRLPEVDLIVGDLGALPYDDDRFDAVTGFCAFELATDCVQALRQARRVTRPGGSVLVATYRGRERCEVAACLDGVAALVPSTDPFALSDDGVLEALAVDAGLRPVERTDVLCVWSFRDDEHALRALSSTGPAVQAAEAVGPDLVREVLADAVEPYALSGGGFRLENTFTHLVTQV